MSLYDLAVSVRQKSERLSVARSGNELANNLSERAEQIASLTTQAENLHTRIQIIKAEINSVRIPKQRLRQRISRIKVLESDIASSITKITEPDPLDAAAFQNTFNEVEDVIRGVWTAFAKSPPEANSVTSVDDPEVRVDVDQLKSLLSQLEAKANKLPTSAAEVQVIRDLIEQIAGLIDKVRASGYDPEIMEFLAKARSRGFPLNEMLENPKILEWLRAKNHAIAFRVIHQSSINFRL